MIKKNIDALYIHIPFCDLKCYYCDFCSFINMNKEFDKYCEYLIKELQLYPDYVYDTIYFGGGTPSILSINHIEKILKNVTYKKDAEITLEMNPKNIDLTKLKLLKEIGINRLSIGIQSFNDDILKRIGRNHSSEEAIKVYNMARTAGFENISIDLIFGVPNQLYEDVVNDLNYVKKLNPEHISIYSLIWEKGTVFWKKKEKGLLTEIDEDLELDMHEKIISFLKQNEYIHYEISSFSKQLKKSKHNTKYWQNKEFVGVGLGASSYYSNMRYNNVKKFKQYYEYLDNNLKPRDENTIEIIDSEEKKKLSIILGLRQLDIGIPYFENEKIVKFLDNNFLKIEGNRLKLTYKGMLLSNEVFIEFI